MADDLMKQEAVAKRSPNPIAMGDRGLRLTTLEEAYRFAQYIVASGLTPKGIDTPEKALIAMQYGAELGFSPMRSLSAITVVNGKPGIYGEAALGKIRATGVCVAPPVIRHDGEGDTRRAIVRFQRKDMPNPVEVEFSASEAKAAKLWNKQGPWTDYRDDMLGWRAVGRMVKRYFSDVTLGLVIAEELRDYPTTDAPTPDETPDPLLLDAPAEPQPIEATVVDTRAAQIEGLLEAFKSANTIVGVERAWKAAKPLRETLDPETLDRTTLAYEARLDEIRA